MSQRHRVPSPFIENLDSIGLGKLTDNQMKAVVDLVKAQNRLGNQRPPEPTGDRGIVICGGGRYLDWAWVNARWLRHSGIQHPIQVWFLGKKEMPESVRKHFTKLDVELIDAFEVRQKHWHRRLQGWTSKHFACAHAPFEDIVFYDADCFASCDPDHIWNDPEYQATGALFFSDVKPCRATDWAYIMSSVRIPDHEMESGVFFWNRPKAWSGIRMTNWYGEHSEVWDKHIHGDKCRPYLAFGTTDTKFIQSTERSWEGWGISQRWKGREVAKHSMSYKRGEHGAPHPLIPGFFTEWQSLTL